MEKITIPWYFTNFTTEFDVNNNLVEIPTRRKNRRARTQNNTSNVTSAAPAYSYAHVYNPHAKPISIIHVAGAAKAVGGLIPQGVGVSQGAVIGAGRLVPQAGTAHISAVAAGGGIAGAMASIPIIGETLRLELNPPTLEFEDLHTEQGMFTSGAIDVRGIDFSPIFGFYHDILSDTTAEQKRNQRGLDVKLEQVKNDFFLCGYNFSRFDIDLINTFVIEFSEIDDYTVAFEQFKEKMSRQFPTYTKVTTVFKTHFESTETLDNAALLDILSIYSHGKMVANPDYTPPTLQFPDIDYSQVPPSNIPPQIFVKPQLILRTWD